jgi:hypothetical protein
MITVETILTNINTFPNQGFITRLPRPIFGRDAADGATASNSYKETDPEPKASYPGHFNLAAG